MNPISAGLPSHLTADPVKDAPKAKNTLGKDDFMKLLMAQLTNQDPLKPMEHQEFSAQLAQFGSLEQLQNIGKGIESLRTGIGSGAKMSALGMIGRQVQAVGNEVTLIEGQAVSIKYAEKDGIAPVKAYIYDGGGKQVREVPLNSKDGKPVLEWDGKDDDGKSLASGKYTFRVQGVDKKGQSQDLSSELSGRVVGVEMNGENPMLVVQTATGKTNMELSKVQQVSVESEAAGTNTALPGAKPTAPMPMKIAAPVVNAEDSDEEAPEVPVTMVSGAASEPAEEPDSLEAQSWRGFPPFASMEGLKR